MGEFHFCVTGIVAPDTLTLRLGPSVDSPAVALIEADRCLIEPLGPWIDGWAPVQLLNRQDSSLTAGYVSSNFLTPGTERTSTQPFNPNLIDPQWCITPGAPWVRMRIAPLEEASVLALIPGDTCGIFPATEPGTTGAWVRVSYDLKSRGGWIPADRLVTTERFLDLDSGPVKTVQFAFAEPTAIPPENLKAYTSDGLVVGAMSAELTLRVPQSIDPETLVFSAWGGDKYCRMSVSVGTAEGSVYPLAVGLGLCV